MGTYARPQEFLTARYRTFENRYFLLSSIKIEATSTFCLSVCFINLMQQNHFPFVAFTASRGDSTSSDGAIDVSLPLIPPHPSYSGRASYTRELISLPTPGSVQGRPFLGVPKEEAALARQELASAVRDEHFRALRLALPTRGHTPQCHHVERTVWR